MLRTLVIDVLIACNVMFTSKNEIAIIKYSHSSCHNVLTAIYQFGR